MKIILLAIILITTNSLHAAAPPRGSDRLLELVLFPEMNLTFSYGLSFQGEKWIAEDYMDLPSEISQLRDGLKQQPENIERLLQLGDLLQGNGQTNEAKSYLQYAEQICRHNEI